MPSKSTCGLMTFSYVLKNHTNFYRKWYLFKAFFLRKLKREWRRLKLLVKLFHEKLLSLGVLWFRTLHYSEFTLHFNYCQAECLATNHLKLFVLSPACICRNESLCVCLQYTKFAIVNKSISMVICPAKKNIPMKQNDFWELLSLAIVVDFFILSYSYCFFLYACMCVCMCLFTNFIIFYVSLLFLFIWVCKKFLKFQIMILFRDFLASGVFVNPYDLSNDCVSRNFRISNSFFFFSKFNS